nr:peptide chain release factor N(5)-glutamine methyltransferase [Roseicitreum antarcticum]
MLPAVARLRAAGVPDPVGDARRLLAHALNLAPDRLTLHMGDAVPADAAARLAALIAERARRRPVSHLTGQRLFWGRQFAVTADVLDPRPETETLIAAALAAPWNRVLDLGTGSGAILLTLLAERPPSQGAGVDLSLAALDVARGNAEALGLRDRATFVASDWWAAVTGRFDLIVSNPPYIADTEISALSAEVREWEPRMALVPACDDGTGLAAYRVIAAGALAHLAPGGHMMVEIGPTQADAVAAILTQAGLCDAQVAHDMDARPRIVTARAPQGA